MFYVADRTEMQEIDRLTIEEKGVPGILLMERAAITVLEEINSRLTFAINAGASLFAIKSFACCLIVSSPFWFM